jgi:signal transduction histidine kinase
MKKKFKNNEDIREEKVSISYAGASKAPASLRDIIHDINNMHGAISGYIDLIRIANNDENGVVRDVTLSKRISAIQKALERLKDLMETLKRGV